MVSNTTLNIIFYEIRRLLKTWSPYIYFIVIGVISCMLFIIIGGGFKSAAGISSSVRVWSNSAANLYRYISMINMLATIVVAALMGRAIYNDFHYQTFHFFFTKPISKISYLLGRFIGTYFILVIISVSVGMGAYLSSLMPFVEQESYGPHYLIAYLWPYVIAVLPNLFFTGAFFFCLGALSRKMMPVYAAAVILVIAYSIGTEWVENLDNLQVAALLDPFGFSSEEAITRYWTIAEKNIKLLPLTSTIMFNRVLWCTFGIGFFVLTICRFRFLHPEYKEGKTPQQSFAEQISPIHSYQPVTRDFSVKYIVAIFNKLSFMEFRITVKSLSFLVIVLSAVLFIFSMSTEMGTYLGTKSIPLTYATLETLGRPFELFVFIIIVFYSGELIWRDRDLGMDQLTDSTPAPSWIMFLSKISAAILIHLFLMSILLVCCLVVQICLGYFTFELGQYFINLFVMKTAVFLPFWILGLFIQTIINRKALGQFIMILIFILAGQLPQLGFEHYLYRLFRHPTVRYSDLNGYGPFLEPFVWFSVWWLVIALFMAIITVLFWIRGLENEFKQRLAVARIRSKSVIRPIIVATIVLIIGVGGFIYYNTNILNDYTSLDNRRKARAKYEQQYKSYTSAIFPRVTAIDLSVDIFPEKRSVLGKGTYTLVNKNDKPISEIMISFPGHIFSQEIMGAGIFKGVTIHNLDLSISHRLIKKDIELGTYLFSLDKPLGGGEYLFLNFDISYQNVGFPNGVSTTKIVKNGTFFDSMLFFPSIGYNSFVEINNNRIRKRYDLPEKTMVCAPIDDEQARQNVYISSDADRISFNAVVSTSSDQIALAPGRLVKEWQENNRRYFHYKTDCGIWHFYSFLSGRYEVINEFLDGVQVDIYYHKTHTYNLEILMQAMKDSLRYYSSNFGPFQHKNLRIIEFPRYNGFAQSFATTIPFSEGIGFVANVDPDDDDDLDYPYYITAHEIAHQWWAHQVCPAHVQGASVLTETLARYAADILLRKHIGEKKFHRYTRFRLDEYLRGRSAESTMESPLYLADDEQHYLYYAKGELVMLTLADYIGSEAVNRALARLVNEHGYKGPPYPTTRELLACLRAVTPQKFQYIIDDLFEKIVIFQLEAVSAEAKSQGQGQYDVVMNIITKKYEADGLGNEREVCCLKHLDIGVFGQNDQILYLEKHSISQSETTITITVNGKPATAGIDPFYRMIDRNPVNNTVSVIYREDRRIP